MSPGPATERLLLLDAPSLWFRAFYGVPESVTAPDGTPANALRGFLDMTARLLRDLRPDRFVAALDLDWRPAWRVALLPSYKAHRVADDGGDASPNALDAQVPAIEAVLDAVGLARLGAVGYEADDVIGTLAVRAGRDGATAVDIVTGDRDLFQLVRDDVPVHVLYTQRGIGNLQRVDDTEVRRRYGVTGLAYTDLAVLRGDPSDGLPGVPGIGEKTAAALVAAHGSLAGVLAALDAGTAEGFPAGSRARLAGSRDYLAAALPVVRVVTDLALPDIDDRVPAGPRDPVALLALSQRWGLDSPLNRLLAALEAVTSRER